MTGRTHDLAAFAALSFIVSRHTDILLSPATAVVAVGANMIGGLAPDIDQPTGDLWNRLPAGTLVSRLFTPFLGGHRHLSHSLLGVALFGFLSRLLLTRLGAVVLVDMGFVWWSFMIGYASHIIMDLFTREGVPLFFPIPIHIGIPPLSVLRIKTGGIIETLIVFPGLLVATAYVYYSQYHGFLNLVKHTVK